MLGKGYIGRLKTRDDETYILSDDDTYGNKKKKTMWQVCQKAKKISASLLCVIQTRHVVRNLNSKRLRFVRNIVLK